LFLKIVDFKNLEQIMCKVPMDKFSNSNLKIDLLFLIFISKVVYFIFDFYFFSSSYRKLSKRMLQIFQQKKFDGKN
jgi:hypothetical protein